MKVYKQAIELQKELTQIITFQDGLIQRLGECYPRHSQDNNESKKLLNALNRFIIKNKEMNK